jgi:2-(1,2-epoxy-1,2-dihydrophenyl)acetyl-CoA isomerase
VTAAAPTAPVVHALDGSLALITFDRPERHNVLDEAASRAFIEAVGAAAADVARGAARAVLLRGRGRSFCAGGDIEGFAVDPEARAALLDRMIPPLNQAIATLAGLPVPVVCAINGAVGGGGLGVAFCADIVIAAESMVLRGGYGAIGLTPDVGSSWFLVRAIGAQRAKRVFFCNEKIGARQCLDWGLVTEVVPDDRLEARALELARSLAASATHALGRIKSLADGASGRTLQEQLALEHRAMVESGRDPESDEGVAAFIDRRAPRFGR